MRKKAEKAEGKVTITFNNDEIATFDFADIASGECNIEFTESTEELILLMLEVCLDNIEFYSDQEVRSDEVLH